MGRLRGRISRRLSPPRAWWIMSLLLALTLGLVSGCGRGPDTSVPPKSYEEAMALVEEGERHLEAAETVPLAQESVELQQAIEAYEAALSYLERYEEPREWAYAMASLGASYSLLETGDFVAHQRNAIECFEQALLVYTKGADPESWALTMRRLGTAYTMLPSGDRATNYREAVACYEAALTVLTRDDDAEEWARAMQGLGTAYSVLPTGDPAENVWRAIQCHEEALIVYTRESHPREWARTTSELGTAWSRRPDGDRAQNVAKAIKLLESVAQPSVRESCPREWAVAMLALGWVYADMPSMASDEQAVECFRSALQVITQDTHPLYWACANVGIGAALPGDTAESREEERQCFERALTVLTEDIHASYWALAHLRLGLLDRKWSGGTSGEKRIDHLRNALRFYTEERGPVEFATASSVLGAVLAARTLGDREENLEEARRHLEAALRVREADPAIVSMDHAYLAYVLVEREEATPSELDLARAHLAEAERGFTQQAADPRFEVMKELLAQTAERLNEELDK